MGLLVFPRPGTIEDKMNVAILEKAVEADTAILWSGVPQVALLFGRVTNVGTGTAAAVPGP